MNYSVKIIMVATLLSCFAETSFSQGYEPMLADSNEWYVMRTFEGSITNRLCSKNDTLIKGKTYKAVGYCYSGNQRSEMAFIRDDTINKRVYAMPPMSKDTTEVIYCDFNLQLNDSIYLFDVRSEGDSIGWFYLDSIKAFNTFNGIKKQFFLSGIDQYEQPQYPVWIEMVGPLGHPAFPYYTPDDWQKGLLNCRYRNGFKIFQSELSKSFGDCDIRLGVEELSENNPFNLYPNPTSGKFQIESAKALNYSVRVFDIHGTLILKYEHPKEIDISELKAGLYLVQIKSQTQIYYKRVLKE